MPGTIKCQQRPLMRRAGVRLQEGLVHGSTFLGEANSLAGTVVEETVCVNPLLASDSEVCVQHHPSPTKKEELLDLVATDILQSRSLPSRFQSNLPHGSGGFTLGITHFPHLSRKVS